MQRLEIYTDGACHPNPGVGGWAYKVIPQTAGRVRVDWGSEMQTTNQRMELQAAVAALESVEEPSIIVLHTDSMYLKRGLMDWSRRWVKNNWKRKTKEGWKEVMNSDLWKKLVALRDKHPLTVRHVKAHSGHPINDEVDRMACSARKSHTGKDCEK